MYEFQHINKMHKPKSVPLEHEVAALVWAQRHHNVGNKMFM